MKRGINALASSELVFIRLTVVLVSFCRLTKGIAQKICRLCVYVIIKKLLCVWILFQNASSHYVSGCCCCCLFVCLFCFLLFLLLLSLFVVVVVVFVCVLLMLFFVLFFYVEEDLLASGDPSYGPNSICCLQKDLDRTARCTKQTDRSYDQQRTRRRRACPAYGCTSGGAHVP